ncbi:MAG TPA: glycosyltransferase family 39 protein [Chloroflexaceae bacterium]|nr:glycosyltransferase family 39 protein [Chloroflexaceae bacterium]
MVGGRWFSPRRRRHGQHLLRAAPRTEPPEHERAAARPRALGLPAWLAALLLIGIALLPRAAGLADFYTTDEAYFWQVRVARFAGALAMGDWAATNQTGHPGVTTMWLGALGQQLAYAQGLPEPGPGGGAGFLAHLRAPLAVANALAVGLGYLLLLRLVRPATAALAALLWAGSPFLIAHGRLLHLDALLASCMTLSLLCLLVAVAPRRPGERRPFALVGAGLFGGLALLTKAPALLLPPVSALVLLGAGLWGRPLSRAALGGAARAAAPRMAAWLAVAALTFVALWPAMWVAPGEALGAVVGEVVENGAQPHSSGNFFMGRPTEDPGWPFYLSVVVWRGEAPTLLGLGALLALAGARISRARRRLPPGGDGQTRPSAEPLVMAALALFVALFTLALTLLAKKFDRYLLPIWPALQILGAVGLVALLDAWLARTHALAAATRRAIVAAAAATVVVAALLPPLLYRPYYLAYYNPLLGGGAPAQGVLLAGWGEGMEQAGAWLSGRPDLRRGPVLSWLPPTLTPFVPADVPVHDLDLDTLVEPANYAVVYASVAERDTRTVAEAYAMQTPPLHTVRVRGVTYATVHQLPRPFTMAAGAVFEGVHLRGFSDRLLGATLVITPSWDIQVDRPGGVFSFMHVLDERGERVAQIDALLDDGMFATWQAGQQFGTALPLALPPDLPPGTYTVVLGLYTQPDGARLPLWHGEALPEELAGPHAVELLSFRVGEDARREVLAR